jgi:hypothetical protein
MSDKIIRKPYLVGKIQIFAVAAAILYVVFILSYQYKNNYFPNERYPITSVTEDVKRLASHVTVGMYINNFSAFSFYKNKFHMNCVVWFRFPVGTNSLNTIEQFSIQSGKIKRKSKPIVKITGEDVVVSFNILVEFVAHLNHKHFPASGHNLNIILENRLVSQNELVFDAEKEGLRLSDNLLAGSWKPIDKSVETGYIKSDLVEENKTMEIGYPCVVFSVKFLNHDFRRFVTLYLPLFLLLFVAIFSLFAELGSGSQGALVGGAVPGIIFYRLVINSLSPASESLTKIDSVYFLLVALALIILFFYAYTLLVLKIIKDLPKTVYDKRLLSLEKQNEILLYVVLLALTIFLAYITFF